MSEDWDAEQRELQSRVASLRAQLDLDAALARFGSVTLVGGAALGLMVARDVDLTVTVVRLDEHVLAGVGALAAKLVRQPEVRAVLVRDDTGRWNVDPAYPDGIYLNIDCCDDDGARWSFDIWFIDDPDRQPDLQHLRTLAPRITPDVRSAVLSIKRATRGRRPDGSPLSSYDIYTAVLDADVRDLAGFHEYLAASHRE